MTKEERKLIESTFVEETGLSVKMVSKIGFSVYMIEASNGETYMLH